MSKIPSRLLPYAAGIALAFSTLSGPVLAGTQYIGELTGVSKVKDRDFDEVYIKGAGNFSQYQKILIEPVDVLFGRDKELEDLSERDLQGRQDYLYDALVASFGEAFEIVDEPGPDVLRLKASLTSVWFNKPSLDYQKQSKYVQLSSFDSFYTGRAAFQADITDSISGELLGVVVDHRKGWSMDNNSKNRWTFWGDAEDAMDKWAERLPSRLQ